MIFKGYERIDTAGVYDGLDSTSTTLALSARQGNVLNEKINQGRLVSQTTLTTATQTVTIEGLDIIRDGGVYDIEICGKTAVAADVFVRVNNLSPSTYWMYGWYWSNSATEDISSGALTFALRKDRTYWYCAHSLRPNMGRIEGTLSLNESSKYPMYSYRVHALWNATQLKSDFTCVLGTTVDNITSLWFQAQNTTFAAGTTFKIWKR